MNATESLCTHDRRNTNGCSCEEAEPGSCPGRTEGCGCDNCFYGRDALARAVLTLTSERQHFLSARDVEVVRHSLGASHPTNAGYRNYYNAEERDPELEDLVSRGIMVRGSPCPGGSRYYHVAPVWVALVLGWSRAEELCGLPAVAVARAERGGAS